ncbi:glycine-rich domain-containing protein [Marinospirillum celere]|uniref:glycine-rich domain-containing protein n=1 Tax=Marinospirillum celere TaxID=1122252 RepID=UPI000B874B16|nr:hypothetical protein [Marinospirillum celere]
MTNVNSFDLLPRKIAELDLRRLQHKYTESSEAELTPDEWAFAEKEYRKFLALKLAYPAASLVPSKMVDYVWHAHLLDTRAYREDCRKIFGRFIDHYPYFGIYGEDDQQLLQATFEKTKQLYQRHFGPYPGGSNPEAARCEGHACHVPTTCACRVSGACK